MLYVRRVEKVRAASFCCAFCETPTTHTIKYRGCANKWLFKPFVHSFDTHFKTSVSRRSGSLFELRRICSLTQKRLLRARGFHRLLPIAVKRLLKYLFVLGRILPLACARIVDI